MPTTTAEVKFSCASCGKEYRWKPELAGKQAKCKCGATISIPRTPPPPPVPKQEEIDLDGLYALAAEEKKAGARLAADPEAATTQQGYRCPSCGTDLPVGTTVCPNCSLDLKTGRKRAAPGTRSNGVAAASAGFAMSKRGAGGGKQLALKGGKYGDVKEPEGFADFSMNRDVYLPLGLVVAGVVLYFVQLNVFNGLEGEADEFGRMYILVNVIADAVILFVAMLFALRMVSTSEKMGIVMLKFLGVAIAPGAAGEIVREMVSKSNGTAGWLAGAVVALAGYYALIKVLFNLESSNGSKLMFMIYLVRVWGKRLAFIVLVVVFIGMLFKKASEAAEKGEGGGTDDVRSSLSPADQAKASNEEIEKSIQEDKAVEARAWLKEDPTRTVYNLGDKAAATVESLYAMGATKVLAGSTAEGDGGKIATTVVVELPADPEARAKLFDWANTTEKKLDADNPNVVKDVGQKYILVNFDNS